MREFLRDEDIRPAALAIYKNSPLFFYYHSEVLKQIFPNEWFKKIINEEGVNLVNDGLWNMFLLFNGHSLPQSFGPPIYDFIDKVTRDLQQGDVSLL